jgi:hypothetical protein
MTADYFEIASEMETVHHKILLLGDSGDGKTFTAVLGKQDAGKDPMRDRCIGDPSVAILVCEEQAKQTIRIANPQARIKVARNMDDVRAFIELAADGVFAGMGITRLVLDGLTEIQRFNKDAIMQENDDERFYQDDWGTLATRDRHLLRTLRALPYDIICTALTEEKEDERRKQLIVRPMFEGRKTPAQVAQFFGAVGMMQRHKRKGSNGAVSYEYRALFEAPERFRCVKGVAPLVGAQPACAGYWLDLLNGTESGEPLAEVSDPFEDAAERAEDAEKEKEKRDARRGRGGKRRQEESRAK